MEVRELHLYSEKVEEEDVKNFLNRIVKTKFPILGFFSPSDILAINAFQFVIKRDSNTVRFYVREKHGLQNVSPLIFPFRLCDPSLLTPSSGSFFPFPRLYFINGSQHDLLDFILKENIEQLTLNITKIIGGFLATGTAINKNGHMGKVVIRNPQKFLKINMEKNPSIYIELLEPLPKQIATTSKYPIFEERNASLGVDNYDPFQHTLIAGTSGSGKSKALFVLLKALEAKYGNGIRIIMVDPHGEFSKLMPNAKIVDFIGNYIEPLDVGKDKTPMLTQLVSQLIASSIGQENKYSERVLFYAVHLLSSIGKLELNNISALLTDSSVKAEFVSQCDNDEVKRFFDEEYNDIHIHHFNNAILPILNFIGEYQLYLGKEKKRESLLDTIHDNKMTIVSFDPKFFGRRMISFLAGAIINQMYILAITGKLQDKPTILVVDEFPRVETRVTRDILSETRKFNLFAYLSCQYLGQLSKDVLDSIVSNTRNIIAFKINRQDATMLSSIMEIKVEEYFKKHRSTTELEESKKEMFVRLHQRECIVRLFDGVKYLLPMKLRIVDAKKWGLVEGGNIPNTGQKQMQEQEDASNGKGVPLRYAEAHRVEEGQKEQVQVQTQQKEVEVKKEDEKLKIELPDPMSENELLKETPDVIYQLEKAQMAYREEIKPKINEIAKKEVVINPSEQTVITNPLEQATMVNPLEQQAEEEIEEAPAHVKSKEKSIKPTNVKPVKSAKTAADAKPKKSKKSTGKKD